MTAARVLVVDDEPRNVKLLADLLAAEGYAVGTAASGEEALARIAEEPPDLVLLDVLMPGMSGYETCRAIRESEATAMLPVVMVTALEASEERIKGLDAGADDFLSKPIHRPELLARVRSLLRVKQLHDVVGDQARQLRDWNQRLEERVAEQVEQLERLGKLKRFLPPEVAERVVAGGADDPLRSHRREIAVVAVELRGFTAFAETNEPEEVMSLLQEYHEAIGRLVLEHEGTLERFTGEGLMVFFNDPVPQTDAAQRAVGLALAVHDRAEDLSARWRKLGVELRPGIGISQGYATLGAIGLEARSDYAAVGTVTLLAARLAEAAPPGGTLVSQRVLAAVEASVESEPAGELELRGFSRPVAACRVLRASSAAGGSERDGDGERARVFRREGEYWTLAYEGESCRLRDSKGLRYIAHLLRHPERDFHALDLVALERLDGSPSAAAGLDRDEDGADALGDAGTLLDEQAKGAYRARLEDLRAETAEAESFGDAGRLARARSEMDALTRQLAAAVGLGGRDRRVGAAAERARVSVTRSISSALKRVGEHSRPLARYLDAAIRTGTFCVYRPPEAGPVRWEI